MLKKLIKTLIKHKIIKADISKFLENYAKDIINNVENILNEILVLVSENEKIDRETLKNIIFDKIKMLNIDVTPSNLEAVYQNIVDSVTKELERYLNMKMQHNFDRVDLDTINSMRKGFYWMGRDYNQKLQNELKDIIERTFKGDIANDQIGKILKEHFFYMSDRDEQYFRGVAEHIALQSQNISRVSQAIKYDVMYFKVLAKIDNRTSDICRSMHNKIIPAEHLNNQINNIFRAKTIEEKKNAATWQNAPFLGNKLPKNFGLPPYHFRCRTMIIPVFIKEEVIDNKVVKFTNKNDDEVLRHIDKTNTERVLKRDVFEKLKLNRYHANTLKDIIEALDSINEIGMMKNGRTIAKSNNGYILVFENENLLTAFKPYRLKNYFDKVTDKKEVIKWQEPLISKLKNLNGYWKTKH